jgi:hypothetical protein
MEFPPGRHTGEASRVTIIEADGMFRQARKIRGDALITAIGIQLMPVKRIKHNHNSFHNILLLLNSFRTQTSFNPFLNLVYETGA